MHPSRSTNPSRSPRSLFFSFPHRNVRSDSKTCTEKQHRTAAVRPRQKSAGLQGLTLQALRRITNQPRESAWSWHQQTHTRGPRRQDRVSHELKWCQHCVRGRAVRQTARTRTPRGSSKLDLSPHIKADAGPGGPQFPAGNTKTKSFQEGALPGLGYALFSGTQTIYR